MNYLPKGSFFSELKWFYYSKFSFKMRPKLLIIVFLLSSIIISCNVFQNDTISFNEEVRPILNKKCIVCHGGVKKNGGFSLLFEEEAKGKTKSGKPAIVEGDAEHSEFIKRLTDHDPEKRMPKDADPLTDEEIEILTTWVNEGAKWEIHWAFIPPKTNIEVPQVGDDWAKNDIDKFIYEKLKKEGLTPNKEADKTTLLRRLSLDLTGLPPTQKEVQDYLNDKSENAYEKQVNRLLKSPHFGEKWASMWLDVARYADSKGYEKDLYRSIWQYRDYVIKAFNEDMPFNQFTVEQLAGDLLPNPTENQLIATAFHRNTMSNDEGGTNDEEFRIAAMIERVGTTWEAWQGTTMACVQCHSHPYDPIRHEEFYQFMAYLNNTQDHDLYNEKPKLYSYSPENEAKIRKLTDWIKKEIPTKTTLTKEFLDNSKREFLNEVGYRKIEAEDFDSTSRHIELWDNQTAIMQTTEGAYVVYNDVDLTGISSITYNYSTSFSSFIEVKIDGLNGKTISYAKVPATQAGEPGQWYRWKDYKPFTAPIQKTDGKHTLYIVFHKDKEFRSDLLHMDWIDFQKNDALMNRKKAVRDSVYKLASIQSITTPILKELLPSNSRKTHVFTRGNWLTKGQEVKPNLPKIFKVKESHSLREGQGRPSLRMGLRLEMANWLVSEKNPLTARVMVNRFWEQIFGNGIVETVEDFGSQGAKPTHPELLDWLAVRFQKENAWSVKKLLKEIVMSATYRQSSEVKSLEIDPFNRFLARGARVRLSAEQIRDQALTVTELLNPRLYGEAVFPPSPINNEWRKAKPEDLYRRAIYTHWKRTDPYPAMTTFDSPQRNICVSRRVRTNTPLQALNTLNDTVFVAAAQNLALKMLKNGNLPKQQIAYGYQKILFKQPNPQKLDLLLKLYQTSLADFRKRKDKAKAAFGNKINEKPEESAALMLVANAMMNLDEFLTR
jgi:hypothetical protein